MDSAGTSWREARRASWSLRRAAARTAIAERDSSRPWPSPPMSYPLSSTAACYGFSRPDGSQNLPVVGVGEDVLSFGERQPPQPLHLVVGGAVDDGHLGRAAADLPQDDAARGLHLVAPQLHGFPPGHPVASSPMEAARHLYLLRH